MAARCRVLNPIHCNSPPPSRLFLLLLSFDFWQSEGNWRGDAPGFFFGFSCFSALGFFFFLVGDLDSPGLVLMWAAVSTVTDAGDKARAPAFGQGHQRIADSSALFTQSLPLSLSLSLSLFLSYIQPPSVFLSLLLHTPTVIFFSFLASPLMVSFSSRARQAFLFLKKKRSDAVHSTVIFSYGIDISVLQQECLEWYECLGMLNVNPRCSTRRHGRWLLMDTICEQGRTHKVPCITTMWPSQMWQTALFSPSNRCTNVGGFMHLPRRWK